MGKSAGVVTDEDLKDMGRGMLEYLGELKLEVV